jgi:hypothetical protein
MSCTTCHPHKERELSPRELALAAGEKFFVGHPCIQCGERKRYTSSRTCVACIDRKNALYKTDPEVRAKRQKIAREYARSDRLRTILNNARNRSAKLGLEFNLTKEDIPEPDVCPVLGIPLDFRDRDHTPSLDKIEPSKGYVRGNVAMISGRANRIKSDASWQELEAIAAYVKRSLATQSEKPVQLRLVA